MYVSLTAFGALLTALLALGALALVAARTRGPVAALADTHAATVALARVSALAVGPTLAVSCERESVYNTYTVS